MTDLADALAAFRRAHRLTWHELHRHIADDRGRPTASTLWKIAHRRVKPYELTEDRIRERLQVIPRRPER